MRSFPGPACLKANHWSPRLQPAGPALYIVHVLSALIKYTHFLLSKQKPVEQESTIHPEGRRGSENVLEIT